MTAPPANSGFGCAGAPRFASASRYALYDAFGGASRPEGHEMQALRAGPGSADRARRRIPERWMRLLQRPQRHRHVLVDEVLAPVGERVGREAGTDAVERVEEDVA
jgi:hypothetical protein